MYRLHENHLPLDIYGIPKNHAESMADMTWLLGRVNSMLFRGNGHIMTMPVFDSHKPKNDGISGAVLDNEGFFTCHTFSNRNVAFVDAYIHADHSLPPLDMLVQPLHVAFEHDHIRTCTTEATEGFGNHIIIRLPPQNSSASFRLLDDLVSTIGMTKLSCTMSAFYPYHYAFLQPIAESHIAIFGDEQATILNVFSCKPFSIQEVYYTLATHGTKPLDVVVIYRGIELADKHF